MNVNVIYGVKNLTEEIKAKIRTALESAGCVADSETVRGNKAGILHSVDSIDKDKELILIVSHHLDATDPFTLQDLIECQNAVPKIKVLLIIGESQKGTGFLSELYSNGFFHAIYDSHTSPEYIAELVVKGREASEARRYYGLSNQKEVRDVMSLDKAVDYVAGAIAENNTYAERLEWLKSRTGDDVWFQELIAKLPANVKEEIAKDPRYIPYLNSYLKAKAEHDASEKARKEREKALAEKERLASQMEAEYQLSIKDAKDAISRALRRMTIGIVGTERRVGTTHQALLLAHYLAGKGYRVAVAEYSGVENKVFEKIAQSYGLTVSEGRVVHLGVDYYPDFQLSKLPSLNSKGYHFVIMDFGVFNKEIMEEFERCILQIVVSGSKVWETPMLDKIFSAVKDEEQLAYFNYLFFSTPRAAQKVIRKNMAPLKNVYFADYVPNPFSEEGYDAFAHMMKDFVHETGSEKRRKTGLFGRRGGGSV